MAATHPALKRGWIDRIDHALNVIREQEAIGPGAVDPAGPSEHADIIGLSGHGCAPKEAGEKVLRSPIVLVETNQLVAGSDARVTRTMKRDEERVTEQCVSRGEEDNT
jgi:hypothetical protein